MRTVNARASSRSSLRARMPAHTPVRAVTQCNPWGVDARRPPVRRHRPLARELMDDVQRGCRECRQVRRRRWCRRDRGRHHHGRSDVAAASAVRLHRLPTLPTTGGTSDPARIELLVAADIIRTVAVTPIFRSAGVLAIIVAIRTYLSFSLEVELEGRWPWQRGRPTAAPPARPSPSS